MEATENSIKIITITKSDGPTMSPSQKRFYASDQCLIVRKTLQDMVASPDYNTDSDYFTGGGTLGFVDRHLHYLSNHASANVVGYLSNLRLMSSIRRKKY